MELVNNWIVLVFLESVSTKFRVGAFLRFLILLSSFVNMTTRRSFLKKTLLGTAALTIAPLMKANELLYDEVEMRRRANKIHQQILTLDSHCDTPLNLLGDGLDLGVWNDDVEGSSKVDFPRMKAGGVDASFFAVFIGQGKRDKISFAKVKQDALDIFSAIETSVSKYPNLAELVVNAKDASRLQQEDKCAIYIGVENGYPIGKDLKNVAEFYRLGARYITLCHTKNNDICDSSTDKAGAEHHGLSPLGVDVVKEMNRLGMMVDMSHSSDQSFYDVLALTEVPIIASHSSARSVCNHPRNLNDEMLMALAANGGVVQLCVLNSYIKEQPENPERERALEDLHREFNNFENLSAERYALGVKAWHKVYSDYPEERANVQDAVDHIDHMVKVAGINHVGIGTDFDGGGGIEGFNDISEAPNLTYELVKRGYSKRDIAKIWGGNFMRVFKAVEKYSEGL